MQAVFRAALPLARRAVLPAKQLPVFRRCLATIKFAESHEFCSLDGDIATIGITAHAANALGDIVYVEMPSVGTEFAAGETFGAVESVKAASDVYLPVSGTVTETNSALEETPAKVNEAPLKEGWFIKIKVSEAGLEDFKNLMDEGKYKEHVDAEEH